MNLSFISQPWVLVAAIVVSEIIDKLSPNIAPQTTDATATAVSIPVFSATPTAIGTNATIVPIDVPTDNDIKQAITNIPAIIILLGSIDKPKFTVESTAPIDFATCAKAPASMNINTIKIILLFPAPLKNISIFSSNFTFLFIINATNVAAKNGTITETA